MIIRLNYYVINVNNHKLSSYLMVNKLITGNVPPHEHNIIVSKQKTSAFL